MAHQVYLACAVLIPQINVQDKHCVVDGAVSEAVSMQSSRSFAQYHKTHFISTSFPVATSVTTSLTQGGGVMGRRSLSPKPHILARFGCCSTTNLIRLVSHCASAVAIARETKPGDDFSKWGLLRVFPARGFVYPRNHFQHSWRSLG
jgi:hypothetical protein